MIFVFLWHDTILESAAREGASEEMKLEQR